jgi:hypothetical protein
MIWIEASMKNIITLAAVAVLLASQAAAAEDVYDFRGIRLGISLAEFRQFPYPDTPKKGSSPVVACSQEGPRYGVIISTINRSRHYYLYVC